jgi:hypothetical protein
MVIAQLRLLPTYLRLPFMPSTWAFTFSWAAVAAAAIIWLQSLQPAGYRNRGRERGCAPRGSPPSARTRSAPTYRPPPPRRRSTRLSTCS